MKYKMARRAYTVDRIEFSESLGVDPSTQIKQYFNEIMGVYNLFGEYENLSIKGSVNDQSMSFALLFKTEKEAKDMHSVVSGRKLQLYGELYKIASERSKKTLTIQILSI